MSAPERYQRVRGLFLEASELSGAKRAAFLESIEDADLRTEVERLLDAPAVDTSALAPELSAAEPDLPARVGHYELIEKLGEGGMGVVYAAYDGRLERSVAIKMVHASILEGTAQKRLLREARVAAKINHPHICQVYEVGEQQGQLFLAMELLEGESLATRLRAGPLPLREALRVADEVLSALQLLHGRGIVHRDLKPSNVFLTPHGAKLLDFGLARTYGERNEGDRLTLTGMFVGTPGFMAPELFSGADPGPPADLFAAAALILEMIAGVPAFPAETAADGFHAVLHDQPPSLTGGPAVEAADRAIQRALAKRPLDRPASAEELAAELRLATALIEGGERAQTARFQRLLVIPYRMLQPDDEIAFLPFGLADALGTSLSGIEGLVVVSSHVGARYAAGELDFPGIADDTECQLVLTGTLLRAGTRVRVGTQLLHAKDGSLVWSDKSEMEIGDLFALQDELARRIVGSLALKLAPGRKRLQSDVPANATAYEQFLRANQIAHNFGMLEQARDLYRACLEADPDYAPAWARLGRVLRVRAKYGHGDPETELAAANEAFNRAFELNPNLSIAHHLYAYHQLEELGESQQAMVNLLRLAARRPTDADLFSGLVVACRFCGLVDASLEADRRARRLDPGIRTSVQFTYWAIGDYRHAVERDDEDLGWSQYFALPLLGRAEEAARRCRAREQRSLQEHEHHILIAARAAIEGDREACVEATRAVFRSSFRDPEGRLFGVRNLIRVGEIEWGLDGMERIVERGFHCDTALRRDPWLEPVREHPRYLAALARATEGREAAQRAYEEAGGSRLLGPGLVDR